MESLPDDWISIRDDSEAEDISMWDSLMLQSVVHLASVLRTHWRILAQLA